MLKATLTRCDLEQCLSPPNCYRTKQNIELITHYSLCNLWLVSSHSLHFSPFSPNNFSLHRIRQCVFSQFGWIWWSGSWSIQSHQVWDREINERQKGLFEGNGLFPSWQRNTGKMDETSTCQSRDSGFYRFRPSSNGSFLFYIQLLLGVRYLHIKVASRDGDLYALNGLYSGELNVYISMKNCNWMSLIESSSCRSSIPSGTYEGGEWLSPLFFHLPNFLWSLISSQIVILHFTDFTSFSKKDFTSFDRLIDSQFGDLLLTQDDTGKRERERGRERTGSDDLRSQ